MPNSSKAKSSGNSGQTAKLVIAIVCLLAAAGLLMYNFGIISFGGDKPTIEQGISAADQKAMQDEAEKNKAKADQTPPARRTTAGSE